MNTNFATRTQLGNGRRIRFFGLGLLGLLAIWCPGAVAWQDVTEPGRTETTGQDADEAGAESPVRDSSTVTKLAIPAKVQRYVQRIIADYDANGDGQLQKEEWSGMGGQPASIDRDRDEMITSDEFASYVAQFGARRRIRLMTPEPPPMTPSPPLLQPTSERAERDQTAQAKRAPGAESKPESAGLDQGNMGPPEETAPAKVQRRRDLKFFVPASRLPQGLPEWFHTRDKDGDAQITLAEYSPVMTPEKLVEFNRYDRNRDGVITVQEILPKEKNATAGGQRPSRATPRAGKSDS